MPIFTYYVRDEHGRKLHGQEVSDSTASLQASLTQRGYQFISAAATNSQKVSFNDRFESWQGVPTEQKIFFTQNLGVMLRSGFSISRAMGTLALQTTHHYFRRVILELQNDVESGTTFSVALKKHPRVFSELFVNMIAAGEVSGKLDDVLHGLTIQMKKDHQLVGKVRGAMIYPIVIIIAMIGAAVAVMVFVMPQLIKVFEENNVTLPLPTRVLIGASRFLTSQWLLVIIGVIVVVVAYIVIGKTRRGILVYDAVLLRMPIAGKIVKKINLARFTRNLSSMLATDIPIIESFQIIGRTLGSAHYRLAMEASSGALRGGQSIAKVLEKYPSLYPPLVQQMVSVGEESGTLDEVSGQLASFFEEEVDQTMTNLSAIIEPVILLVLGVAVAIFALSVMLPIYNLSSAV